MTIFEIRDGAQPVGSRMGRLVGYLFYYERAHRFYTELDGELDEWEAPAMFYGHVKRGIYSIDSKWSMKWVRQRIIPAERQNIGVILKENGLKFYDEYKLLCLSEGRCAQDECYVVKIESDRIDQKIQNRLTRKIADVLPLSANRLAVFFKDGKARLIDFEKNFEKQDAFRKVLREPSIFDRVKTAPGGNGIEWDEDRAVSAEALYDQGEAIAFSYDDLLCFAGKRLVDTAQACALLNVSRQYMNQLVRQGRLHPVLSGEKGRVFLRAEIEKL
ncbi:MAG: DUF2442 domain-containing protein [Lachnospiraceae bacterium]|nr:DUF2442 domain-containing protein [Lachnospiraceae bacterium]